MTQADVYYNQLIKRIHEEGVWDKGMDVRARWKDGTPAYSKSVVGHSFRFDNSEIPILSNKEVKAEAAIAEAPIWMWQKKSNVVQELRDLGTGIWNAWEIKEGKWKGTIGPAYGWILGQPVRRVKPNKELEDLIASGFLSGTHEERYDKWILDQVDNILYQLKTNPASRRHITNVWVPEYLDEMALTPCVYETQWHVKQNKLYLEVRARSSDVPLGNPFNFFQFNVLQRMFAQVLGYELGDFIFHMGDAHIYDRQMDTVLEQIEDRTYDAPTLWLNPEVKSFYDFTMDDIKLIDYEHGPFRKMEAAI